MNEALSSEAPALLCRLLSPYTHVAQVASLATEAFNDSTLTDLVVELANRYFLIPLLHDQLVTHDAVDHLDPELQGYMLSMTEFMNSRNQALAEQAKEIIFSSNQQNISPLLLKGASTLFSSVYPNTNLRFMRDLDILFPEGDISKAQRIFENLGYSIPIKYQTLVVNAHSHHLPPVYREGAECAVEIHIKPLKPFYSYYLTLKSCYATTQTIPKLSAEKLQAVRMSPTDEIIHCFVHSQLVDRCYQYQILNLRQMEYFVRLVFRYEDEIDWETIYTRIRPGLDERIFTHFIYCINQLFNTSFPIKESLASEQALKNYYKKCLRSCYPQYSPLWRLRRFAMEFTFAFSRRNLTVHYNISEDQPMIKFRFMRLYALVKQYGYPPKLVKRLKLTFQKTR